MSGEANLSTAQSNVSSHRHAYTFRNVVPEVTPMSSFSDLTKFLVFSFQESDHKLVEAILANRERGLKEEMRKSKEILEKELKEEKMKVVNLMNSRISFEEKVKKDRDNLIKEGDLTRKKLEAIVKSLREELEKELMRVDDLIKKLSLASMENRRLEEEIRRQHETQNSFKVELEKLKDHHKENELKSREIYEELKLEQDLMKSKLASASLEKKKLEDEMRTQRDLYENQADLLRKSLVVELETNSNLKQKLSLASNEKLKLDEDLRKTRNLEEELRKSRMHLKERIQVLKGGNLDLNKNLELYKENFYKVRDFAEQILGVCDSSVTENVRAGVLIHGSDVEDVSMFYSRKKASNVEGRLIESHISSGESPSTSPLEPETEGQQRELVDILLGASNVEGRHNNSPIFYGKPPSTTPLQAESESQQGEAIDILLGEKSGCLSIQNELEDGG